MSLKIWRDAKLILLEFLSKHTGIHPKSAVWQLEGNLESSDFGACLYSEQCFPINLHLQQIFNSLHSVGWRGTKGTDMHISIHFDTSLQKALVKQDHSKKPYKLVMCQCECGNRGLLFWLGTLCTHVLEQIIIPSTIIGTSCKN